MIKIKIWLIMADFNILGKMVDSRNRRINQVLKIVVKSIDAKYKTFIDK
jgi:hypothetical protein